MKQTLHYNIILRAEPEGGFTVLVPALPGCVTYGKNLDEARRMAKEAIELFQKLKDNYPKSSHAAEMDKYLARLGVVN